MRHRRDRLPFLGYGPAAVVLWTLLSVAPARAAGGSLEIVPDWTMLPILLVAFLLLIYPVNALLFRPVFRVLDAREERIAGTRRRAERIAREADAAVERYESALAKAREESRGERGVHLEEARRESAGHTATARQAAEAEIERARGEMRAALGDARTALRSESEALAREAAARLLGRTL